MSNMAKLAAMACACLGVVAYSSNVVRREERAALHVQGSDSASSAVLVTGGAGFIGSHVSLALLEKGYNVRIVDNLSRGSQDTVERLQRLFPGRVIFHKLDLGDAAGLRELMSSTKPQAVIHAAGIAFSGESVGDPIRYYENNTVNTMNVAAAMEAARTPILIFSSSCATYGAPRSNPVTEETPQEPVSPYGRSKLFAENVLRDWHHRVNETDKVGVAFLRYFNVIGADPQGRSGERYRPPPRQYRTNVRLTTAIFDAAQDLMPSFTIAGAKYSTSDGTAVRDYVHVSDLADAHVAVMESLNSRQDLPTLRYYNVGTGHGVSVKEMVEAANSVVGRKINMVTGVPREGDPAEIFSDPSKIKREVGWSAKRTNVKATLGNQWSFRQHIKFTKEEEMERANVLHQRDEPMSLVDNGEARMVASFTDETEAQLGSAWQGDPVKVLQEIEASL
jgi:UDP-arabinose 4-epimerase